MTDKSRIEGLVEAFESAAVSLRSLEVNHFSGHWAIEDAQKDLDQARAALVGEYERLEKVHRQFISDTVDRMECLPKCDSYGHEELCPVTNPMEAFRKLRAERDALRALLKEALPHIGCRITVTPSEVAVKDDLYDRIKAALKPASE